jgi:hypothetical protein
MTDIATTITITLRTKDVLTGDELAVIMGNVAEHIYGERDAGITEFANITGVDVNSGEEPAAPADAGQEAAR